MKKWLILSLLLLSYTLDAGTFTVDKTLTSSKSWMTGLVNVSECIIKNDAFQKEVGGFAKYTYTTKTPAQVAETIKTSAATATLSTYWTTLRWSKTIAYRAVGDNVLYFNLWKNPRSQKEMVNTTIHEWLHVVGFEHGDNSARGKQDSVPYRVGLIAEKYVGVCK